MSMHYILLILIACACFAADPPEVKLPADVQKVVDARDAEVAKAKAAYDAAVAKATQAATKQMEAVIKARMAKQDLDGAMAAKAVITKWKVEEPKDGDLLSEKSDAPIVAKWQRDVWVWDCKADGTGTLTSPSATYTYKWSQKEVTKEGIAYTIDFGSAALDRVIVVLKSKREALEQMNGGSITLRLVK